MTILTLNGNALHLPLPDKSAQCCITSPPYWGLRDYGMSGQLGLESTPDEYVAHIVTAMREVWRVLRDNGTLWLVLGDSYARNGGEPGGGNRELMHMEGKQKRMGTIPNGSDLKPKDLVGIPWLVAFALRADGWYLRSEIIWSKLNPMPESVTDRPTKAHEQVFLLAKQGHYFYDADAIREPIAESTANDHRLGWYQAPTPNRGYPGGNYNHGSGLLQPNPLGRNRRTVWTIATSSFSGAHFACFPPALVEPMVLAGTSPQACETCGAPWERITERTTMVIGRSPRTHELGRTRSSGTMLEPPTSKTIGWRPTCDCPPEHNTGAGKCIVIDPFAGMSTVGRVCAKHGRSFIGTELNPAYIELAQERTSGIQIAMSAVC